MNSNLSGIGDRLLDIILIYTYAQYLKCDNLYLEWKVNDETNNHSFYAQLRKTKTPFRHTDYLLDNLTKFINLPNNIIFVDRNTLIKLSRERDNVVLNEYMGMRYSIYTFVEQRLDTITNNIKENFIKDYYNNFKKISFINIPENITSIFKNNNIVTIHLRRGDKVCNDGGTTNNIDCTMVNELNLKTKEFINNCISNDHMNICFVSDEAKIKNEYIEEFKDKCNIINFKGDEVSQTYYDLYCLAYSNNILLSQKFSVFSILGSMIGGSTLYYIFDNGKLFEDKYIKNNNIKNYRDF